MIEVNFPTVMVPIGRIYAYHRCRGFTRYCYWEKAQFVSSSILLLSPCTRFSTRPSLTRYRIKAASCSQVIEGNALNRNCVLPSTFSRSYALKLYPLRLHFPSTT